jgi:hypothetical protein
MGLPMVSSGCTPVASTPYYLKLYARHSLYENLKPHPQDLLLGLGLLEGVHDFADLALGRLQLRQNRQLRRHCGLGVYLNYPVQKVLIQYTQLGGHGRLRVYLNYPVQKD